MAQAVRIQCINKTDRYDPHERISHIGGANPDGARWKMTLSAAIAAIEADKYKFWVAVPNEDSVWVIVAVSRYGNKYLKTTNDGDQPNNLLSLPECPA